MRRLTENMMAFRDAPEDQRNVIATSDRADEIGIVTRELSGMEDAVRAALRQKARLAALGSAITKINHDLRNILATARLVSDRLADSSDPKVQRMAPTLVGSIDRAVTLCEQTLAYARDELPRPRRERFALGDLVEEVGRVVALLTKDGGAWQTFVPEGLIVHADRDQLFRVFVNLGRNAVEAGARQVRVTAALRGTSDLTVDVADDGPGIPAKAQDKLFQPFAGTARAGGTGLGLAIARELVRAHGGELTLAQTSADGTSFRIDLPGAAVSRSSAAE
jgi:signal transduction histidine kinase